MVDEHHGFQKDAKEEEQQQEPGLGLLLICMLPPRTRKLRRHGMEIDHEQLEALCKRKCWVAAAAAVEDVTRLTTQKA